MIYFSLINMIVFIGQTSTHIPQRSHKFLSITGKLCSIWMAFLGHFFTQSIHVMQPVLHASLTSFPFFLLTHKAITCFSRGASIITFLGQISTHNPHPVQSEWFTTGNPFLSIVIASKGQISAQSPYPTQLYKQALLKIFKVVANLQLVTSFT